MKRYSRTSRDDQQAFLDYGDRVADGDTTPPTTDLQSTYLRVQRAMRSNATASRDMPDHLRTRTWEDIMQNAAAPAIRPEIGRPRKPAQRTPIPLFRMGWTGMANAALAVLLVVAGFGAWRVFDGSIGGGGSGPAPSEGRYARAPMTPVPQATADVAESAAPAWACDFSDPIPIIPDAMSSPLDDTSLYITPRNQGADDPTGTLMLHCAEEPADIELAQRVVSASGGPIPGVVRLSVLPEGTTTLEEQVPAYLNLTTGQSIEFAGISSTGSISENDWSSIQGSPWVVGRNAEDPSIVEIANLHTMETRPLANLTGLNMTTNEDLPGMGVTASGMTVLAYTHPYTGPGEGGTVMTTSGAPGDLMVLGEHLDSIRWINLPDTLEYVRDIWLSPDGSAIALSVYDGPTQFEHSLSYAIVSADDGTLLAQSGPIAAPGNPRALWIQDGDAITYAANDTVQVLRAEAGAQPEIVLDPGQDISTVRTTYDPDTIVPSIRRDHGSDADPASTDVDRVYSMNVATGETHEFDGMEIGDMHSQMITQANVLLMYDFVTLESPVMVSAYDPVSGALIEDLGELPSPHIGGMTVGKDSFTSSPKNGTTVFTIGLQNILLVQVEDGSPVIHRVEPPTEGMGSADAIVSPDGQTLSMVNTAGESRTRWLLDLSDPVAHWVEVSNEGVSSDPGVIQFVEGAG